LSGPIIVAAIFGRDDFLWFNAERTRHYPPERNHVPAHLTLFHHLPPSALGDLSARLKSECKERAPVASVSGIMGLGTGNAYRIDSPQLDDTRWRLAEAFEPLLIPQDRADWVAHVTFQNKVKPSVAKATKDMVTAEFRPRRIAIIGLAAYHYRDGPWEEIAGYAYGSGHKMKATAMGS
jgi:hypothetical protein